MVDEKLSKKKVDEVVVRKFCNGDQAGAWLTGNSFNLALLFSNETFIKLPRSSWNSPGKQVTSA